MRLVAAILVLAACLPAQAASDLPDGVEQLLTCGHVYSLRGDDARQSGDDGAAFEFSNMGQALLGQARTTLEGAGYDSGQIDDIDANAALMTGFNYGAGMGEEMLAGCLAAWDSP